MDIANKIVMKKISEIKPYIRNPRKNDKTVELLCEIIPKVGFNVPLVIDKNGIIVKGHARFRAGIRLGMKELPCIITDADEEAIKLDRIADNRISEFSEWLNEDLQHELDMLNIDFSDLEFPTANVETIPSFNEFEEFNETEKVNEGDDEKRKKYEEFIASQQEPVNIVSQSEIDKAKKQTYNVVDKPKRYFKCVCEKCGHVMFIDAETVSWSPETGLK